MGSAADLNNAISRAIAEVPECLAAGYIDVDSGLLLAIRTVDSHPQAVIDLVAAATSDLFQGANVTAVENSFKRARGIESDEHYFQEIIVNSKNLLHIFLRGAKHPGYVLCIVCRRSVNLGMALTKSRMALPFVESAL
jgi:hypothetical protein